jgi:hypothetical protein
MVLPVMLCCIVPPLDLSLEMRLAEPVADAQRRRKTAFFRHFVNFYTT